LTRAVRVVRSLALLLALLLGCSDARALTGADPDAVSVQRYTVVVAGVKGRCTGVVVAQDIVLTAAHCLEAGKLRIATSVRTGTLSDVTRAMPHPDYKAAEHGSPDLAVLKLAKPLPGNFSPVHIEPRGVSEGADLVVAGYGKSADNDKGTNLVLRTVLQHVASRNSAYLTLTGVGDSAAGAAPGDSGGPVFSYRGLYALVAIMVGHSGRYTVAIAIAPNYAWIRQTMEKLST
jgi:secreted trypsin-like serine protease